LLVENDRLVGLRFRRNGIEGNKIVPTDQTFDRRASCVISSIGSIPLPIEGIETKGELFQFSDWDLGRLEGFPTVFAAGNIVTGKGNIVVSRKHAKHVTETMMESILGVSDQDPEGEADFAELVHGSLRKAASGIAEAITTQPPIGDEALAEIRRRVAERQRSVGCDGDFDAWIQQVTPQGFE
jgi:hypothetical protein